VNTDDPKRRTSEPKKECSFLKKRTKKLLYFRARAGTKSATENKSFLLLFFKKEVLPFCREEVI
jgi:hypothetical protein